MSDFDRERAIVLAAMAMHTCTSHPDYPDYDEAPCCGEPGPAMLGPEGPQWHHEMGHERGARGICWACEPGAAAAVDALIAAGLARGDNEAALRVAVAATMPRVPRPRGSLTDEQAKRLAAAAKRRADAEAAYRAEVVAVMAEGASFREVRDATKLSTNTLQRWKDEA